MTLCVKCHVAGYNLGEEDADNRDMKTIKRADFLSGRKLTPIVSKETDGHYPYKIFTCCAQFGGTLGARSSRWPIGLHEELGYDTHPKHTTTSVICTYVSDTATAATYVTVDTIASAGKSALPTVIWTSEKQTAFKIWFDAETHR